MGSNPTSGPMIIFYYSSDMNGQNGSIKLYSDFDPASIRKKPLSNMTWLFISAAITMGLILVLT